MLLFHRNNRFQNLPRHYHTRIKGNHSLGRSSSRSVAVFTTSLVDFALLLHTARVVPTVSPMHDPPTLVYTLRVYALPLA
jgi:hypothetical protein